MYEQYNEYIQIFVIQNHHLKFHAASRIGFTILGGFKHYPAAVWK